MQPKGAEDRRKDQDPGPDPVRFMKPCYSYCMLPNVSDLVMRTRKVG
jgi:hypothetical protein